jgi:hypothetical protein
MAGCGDQQIVTPRNLEIMMRFRPTFCLLVLGTFASIVSIVSVAPALAADDMLRPGKWEVVTKSSIDQAGQKMDMPETKTEMCIVPQQAAENTETAPDSSCAVETIEKSDGKLVTRATCGDIVTDSTMTWNDDSYESVTHMVMASNGTTTMVSDMTAQGRYLGDCTQ